MVCPSVRGDNPRALASGLSHVDVDNSRFKIDVPPAFNLVVDHGFS